MAAARRAERPSSWSPAQAEIHPLLEVRNPAVGYGTKNPEGVPAIRIPGGDQSASLARSGDRYYWRIRLRENHAGSCDSRAEPAYHGHILFGDHYINNAMQQRAPDELRRIQYVFQMADTALNPNHTVAQILARPLALFHQLRGEQQQQRVKALLDLVRLPHSVMQRKPGALSGGQKQRVNRHGRWRLNPN